VNDYFFITQFIDFFKIHILDSNQIINRKNIGKMFNAPPEEVKDALTSVAKLDENKTWKLLETGNDKFLETYVPTTK